MIVFGAGVRRLLANSEASGVRYYHPPPPPPPPPPRRRDVRITVGKRLLARRRYSATLLRPPFLLGTDAITPPPNPLSPRTLATLLLTSLWSDGKRWLLRV